MNTNGSMTSEDLQRFIDTHGINAIILPMGEKTPTVMDAARVLGVETHRIIKSLIFIANDHPILAINNGTSRVDRRKIADHLKISRNRVKMASPEKALSISGFVVGSMPPFGHRKVLRTLVDKAVSSMNTIFAGGGGIDTMMQIETRELLMVTHAQLVDISERM